MTAPMTWHGLSMTEKRVLMTVAAMHRELGANARFTVAAVEYIDGHACVGELGILALFGLVEHAADDQGVWGYCLTSDGHAALPAGEDRRALDEHREEADEALREEQ